MTKLAIAAEARFWRHVDASGGLDACWPWLGNRNWRGYGQFRAGTSSRESQVGAHRYSLELALGRQLAPDEQARHAVCDNPPCVNPLHLAPGAHADNMADMVAKGRQATGDRHSSRTHPERVARGERHGSRTHPERLPRGERNGAYTHPERVLRGRDHPRGNARLTFETAAEIRRRAAAGERQRAIAKALGVSQSAVSLVVVGKSWAVA